jgi:hypothetical protein
MNIKLTSTTGTDVLINWGNVDFVKKATSYFGDELTEIHCGKQVIVVKESVASIESMLSDPAIQLLEESND